MWETALTKVNGDTRKVLEALISQFTKESPVPAKVDIKRESIEIDLNEGILDNIKKFFSKGLDFVLNAFGMGLKKAQEHLPELAKSTSELENINQQISGHEEQEINREIPKWQTDQY